MSAIEELRKNITGKRLVIGKDRTVRGLKLGTVSKVFLSSNCPDSVRKQIAYYSGLGGCAVENLDVPNDELGLVCKKPFSISVVGLLKQ